MNQSGKGRKVKNFKLIGNFCVENDLNVTRENPGEWLINMGPCEDMPQRDGRGE